MKRTILILQFLIISAILLLSGGCAHSPNNNTREVPPLSSKSLLSENQLQQTNLAPKHIALLLPLSGPYTAYSAAIRDGFFTAANEQKDRTHYSPVITVVDTTGKNIPNLAQTAIAQGADFIVGPLAKPDVLALLNTQISVPVLALNTTPSTMPITNNALYEYGLSPADEALQAAMKAWQNNHRNIIILAPNNPVGRRIVNDFSNQWKNLGGTVVATQYYDGMTTLSKNISKALQIDSAYQNATKLKNMFRENMRFIPQRRQDFDSIFLVATPEMGRQVEPLLRFYFAGNIPIYATSQIYSGVNNPDANQDLNGISFCEMPWILAPNQLPSTLQILQRQIQTSQPTNYIRLAKFYAMGIDSFNLATQFRAMQSNPQLGMSAATGTLYLTSQHVVYRQLTWAQFQNGQPQLIH